MSENEITKFWFNVATYYDRSLNDAVLKMYVYDCKNIPLDHLRKAFEVYRSSPKAAFFPLPAVLKNIIAPPLDEFSEANEVPSKVFDAIKMFGYTQGQKAKEHVGELAWEVVKGFGGWNHLCSSHNIGNEGTIRAQMRDMAKSKMIRTAQGRANQLPGAGIKALIPNSPEIDETAPRLNQNVNSLVEDALKGKSIEGDVVAPKAITWKCRKCGLDNPYGNLNRCSCGGMK